MNSIKKLYILLIIIVMLVVFTGCSNSDTLNVAESTPEPALIAGNWLDSDSLIRTTMPTDMQSTNPFLVTNRDALNLLNLIYEPFIKLSSTYEPIPNLAQSWSSNEDGTEWTFVVRDGIYWHNTGRELNAHDVIFTVGLMNEMKEKSIHCKLMGYIKKWEALDDRTIVFTTYEPFYGFMMVMDFWVLPYDIGYTSGLSQPMYPIGTGSYKTIDYRPGNRIELGLNENWWQTPPKVQTIIAEPYDDNEIAVSALSLGQIDIVQTSNITVNQLRESNRVNTFEYTTNYYEFLMPNIGQNILLRDKKVRQAIALSIDRQEIISNVYVNHAVIAESPVNPSSWLYEGTVAGYTRDTEEAIRLLKLAGWKKQSPDDKYFNISPDGVYNEFELVLVTNDNETSSLRYETAYYIAKHLEEIGIKVEVRTMDWDTLTTRVSEEYFDLLLGGYYINNIPDLRHLLSTSGSNNMSGYSSIDMDEKLDSVIKQYTPNGLRNSFKEIQDILVEDVPIISLYFRTNTLLSNSSITNVTDVRDYNAFNTIQSWHILE